MRAEADSLLVEKEDYEKRLAEVNAKLETEENRMDSLHKEIGDLRWNKDVLSKNDAYVEKLKAKEEIEKAITALKRGHDREAEVLTLAIAKLEKEVLDGEDQLSRVKRYEEGQKRIRELKEQERKLAAEYENLESELYLTEQFIRSKVKLLEDKINSRFQHARFKLFDVQVNGAVVETCETLYKGVPYPDLNGAAKINIGLDIINTLSEFYGFSAPIFIDNREAVTRLIDTKAQVISLIVSEKDKKLRVEIPNQQTLFKEEI